MRGIDICIPIHIREPFIDFRQTNYLKFKHENVVFQFECYMVRLAGFQHVNRQTAKINEV